MRAVFALRPNRLGVACGVALGGFAVGLILGPLSPPARVHALDSRPRSLAEPSPGQLSVAVNAILYDVITYIADLPVVMNNAP